MADGCFLNDANALQALLAIRQFYHKSKVYATEISKDLAKLPLKIPRQILIISMNVFLSRSTSILQKYLV
jgi:hypothetical protein